MAKNNSYCKNCHAITSHTNDMSNSCKKCGYSEDSTELSDEELELDFEDEDFKDRNRRVAGIPAHLRY